MTKTGSVLSSVDRGERAAYAARLQRVAAAAQEPSADLAPVQTADED